MTRVDEFKKKILGARYELSFSYVTRVQIKKLNAQYRKKNVPTDILSFPLSKSSGEIVVCKSELASHARAFGMSARAYLPYLVIHGMVHLKGHKHGRIMDSVERRYCNAFGVSAPVLKNGADRSRH